MSFKAKPKSTHKQNKKKPSKKHHDAKSHKPNKHKKKKRRKTKSEKKIIRKKHKKRITELKKAFKAKQAKNKPKRKPKKPKKSKSFKKKLSQSIKKKKKKKSKSMKMKIKNKNKPNKSQQDNTKSHRLNIQRKKDIEMAKKRLSKKMNTLEIPTKTKKNNKKSVRIKNMLTDNDIWNEYMFKFGTAPQNISHLQNFSKTSPNCQTLTYKEATLIFNKFSQEEKMDETKQNYIERDMQTAKRRLSQRISTKQSNILLKVIESQLTDIDEIESVYCFVDDDHDHKNEQKMNENKNKNKNRKKSKILRTTMVEIETFIESERAYVFEALSVGLDTFYERLRVHNQINKSIIGDIDIVKIFGNYQTIYNVNSKLYSDLKELPLNRGINELIYSLGNKMVDFIPYFKIYTEYIVKKQAAISHLEHLKKTNKTFKEFLKINELCVKTKLKSLLEEPAHRIPQYLEYLVNIYTSYKHERMTNKKGEKLLLQSIGDIKKVSDQIATKCRDLRSRLLVGSLQRDLFGNKIKLLSAHRFCIAYSSMDMLLNNNHKIKEYKFILLNDIFLISTFPSKFKSAQVMAVYPLIGVRISRYVNQTSLASKGYKLNLLPSNIIIIFENKQKMEKWITIIENAVDKQEHSMKQCNIVDLEKRLRNKKTSKEGASETINITNPVRIKEIEKWKKQHVQTASFASIPKLQSSKTTKASARTRKGRSKTFGGIKKKEKNLLKKIARASTFHKTETETDTSQHGNINKGKVRVMRDEEVLQFDEEIPMENFMKALNSGFVTITNEEQQMEQYKKAAATAKTLVDSSLQHYRASVFSDDWDSSDSDEYWD